MSRTSQHNTRQALVIVAAAVVLVSSLLMKKALTSAPPGPNDDVLAMASQSDGRIIVAGRFTPNRIVRLDETGTPDPEFAAKLTAEGFNRDVVALTVQKDDSIVAGGEFTAFDDAIVGHVARLRADGTLDTDFARAIGTGFDAPVTSIAIQPDGRIVVGGHFLSFNGNTVKYLARLNSDGTLDSSYTGGAALDGPVLSLGNAANNAMVAGGDFRAASGSGFIAGFDANGAHVPLGRSQ